jgi:hypothetical protein
MSSTINDLNETVIKALELLIDAELPNLTLGNPTRRLVVASGNALPTGRVIFEDEDAVYASESQYQHVLKKNIADGAVVISASGEKHAPAIVGDLMKHGLDTYLLTCNKSSSAAQLLNDDRVFETPSKAEPITYNTSTYLGMILAKTKENPRRILDFIREEVSPLIEDMSDKEAFYLIVENRFDIIKEMFITKFDELFGPMMTGRCYTVEQTLHAKTVVKSDREMFISFGFKNDVFGPRDARLNIPLFEGASHGAIIAIGYYLIGKIQSQFHPWFKENAKEYKALQPQLFKRVHKC